MTHAPHWLVSHPMCVPVRPRLSRRKLTSSNRGSTSAAYSTPLTVIRTATLLGALMVVAIVSALLRSLAAVAPAAAERPLSAASPICDRLPSSPARSRTACGCQRPTLAPETGATHRLEKASHHGRDWQITWPRVYRRRG